MRVELALTPLSGLPPDSEGRVPLFLACHTQCVSDVTAPGLAENTLSERIPVKDLWDSNSSTRAKLRRLLRSTVQQCDSLTLSMESLRRRMNKYSISCQAC